MTSSRQVHNGGPTEDVIFDFVAGRLHPQASEWIESHLAGCARCSSVIERVRNLREALTPPPEQPFLRQAALNNVRRRLEARRPALNGRWVPALALAAAVLAIVVGLRLRRAQPPSETLANRGAPVPFVIASQKGTAELEVGSEHAPASAQMALPQSGALSVKAQSRVVAEWGGARVVIDGGQNGARVRLESSGTRARAVRLESGRVLLDVDPLEAGATLAVLTVDAQVMVHGTRFLVERGPTGTLVACERGRVGVTTAHGNLEVPAGWRLSPSSSAVTPLEADDLRAFNAAYSSLTGSAPTAMVEPIAPEIHSEPVRQIAALTETRQIAARQIVAPKPEPKAEIPSAPKLEHVRLSGRPADMLDEARADLLAGNYARAEERLDLLRRAQLDAVTLGRAQLLEAQAYRLDRRADKAVPLLESVARGNGPEAEQGLMLLAQILERDLNDPRRSASVWSESERRFPSGIFKEEAAYRSGESLLAAGETLDGLSALDRYLQAYPRGSHADDAHWAAATARRDRLSDCAGALVHLRAVASGHGQRAELALVAEARCLRTLGKNDEARTVYSAYLAIEPHGRFADEARSGVSSLGARGAEKSR